MSQEQESLRITYERVKQVFADTHLVEQQRASLESLFDKALKRNSPNPIPIAELEGIKELVTEHLWHPELSRQLYNSDR